jgi:hypothetical protein
LETFLIRKNAWRDLRRGTAKSFGGLVEFGHGSACEQRMNSLTFFEKIRSCFPHSP